MVTTTEIPSTSQTILAVVEGEGVYRYHNNNWVKSTGIAIPENTERSNFVWPDNHEFWCRILTRFRSRPLSFK